MQIINMPILVCQHLALSGLTVRLPVWPWQQVRLTVVWMGGDASNMIIHHDVTGLLTVVWRSLSGQIVWAAKIGQGGGGLCVKDLVIITGPDTWLPVFEEWQI